MSYDKITVPEGERIAMTPQGLRVPDRPIVPFIEGDGTGPDITRAARPVWDAAVEKAQARKYQSRSRPCLKDRG